MNGYEAPLTVVAWALILSGLVILAACVSTVRTRAAERRMRARHRR